MIKTFLKALTKAYPDDYARPGLQISYLAEGSYYVAIHRYMENIQNRTIVWSVHGNSLEEAVEKLATSWLDVCLKCKATTLLRLEEVANR